MITQTTTIINRLGLHARAAALLVKLSNSFNSNITMNHAGNSANTKNIMEVLMLAATKGTSLEVTVDGADEEQAMKEVLELISNKFNEAE
ncbi:MAG: HPr family phosphocarrier protein [SAR324 cluster bacterium]|nr:HPr family phosphocarrier protein [SAR324 cluster bacterium]